MGDISFEAIQAVWQPIIEQRIVCLLRDWLGYAAANLGLTKTRELGVEYIRALATKDETDKFFTTSFMIQRDAPQALKQFITERYCT